MRFLISLATRNRPQQLLATVRRSMALWTDPNTTMVIQADADDYATLGALTENDLGPRVKVNVKKREDTIAAKWNRILSEDADVYMIGGDDDPVVTPGYDSKILETAKFFSDGIGMVYGHMSNASFSSIMCPTKKWVKILGYMLPEYFPYWFCDHWIDDLGHMTQRIAYADVRSDQRKVGVTQELREPSFWANWFDAALLLRRKEAYKIIDALDESPTTKDKLRTQCLWVEFRSKWINDNVRIQSRQLEMAMGKSIKDERYQRVKQKAIDMLPQMFDGMTEAQAEVFRDQIIVPDKIVALPRAFG